MHKFQLGVGGERGLAECICSRDLPFALSRGEMVNWMQVQSCDQIGRRESNDDSREHISEVAGQTRPEGEPILYPFVGPQSNRLSLVLSPMQTNEHTSNAVLTR